MYVCVCVYMRVQEPWWRARGLGGCREEQYVLHEWHYRNQRKWEKKGKMQEVFGSACYKNECPFID